ncbi:MAG: hypothetical protein IJ004_03735 [Clostridia bacterium]|nr:hypothetical protein [Clostridia bacterium]
MLDTKGNESKEQSFEEQLKQAKSQGEDARGKGDRLLAQLKIDVEKNWNECFEMCIKDAYAWVKNEIRHEVVNGNIKRQKDKNKVYVYYRFQEEIKIPKDFYEKINDSIAEISKLTNREEREIRKQFPQMASYNEYKMCNPEACGFILVGLNDNCIEFSEELEKRLLGDGIKLEGIVSSVGRGRYSFCFKKIRGKTLRWLVEGRYDFDEGRSMKKLALKFSMEF